MSLYRPHTPLRTVTGWVLIVALGTLPSLPALAQDGVAPRPLQERYNQVLELIPAGQYDQAEGILRNIIQEYKGSDLRKAYDLLVYTVDQGQGPAQARDVARQALEVYPDLTNDRINVPAEIGAIYDNLRKDMFGALQVEPADPELAESTVWLNGQRKGVLPLYLNLVRTGEYELKVAREGYQEQVTTIEIQPNRDTVIPITLNKKGRSRWWLGAGAALAAVLGVVVGSGGSSSTPALEPLPGPPDPPAK